nr:DNA-binding protein [Pseudomonas sp. PP3]
MRGVYPSIDAVRVEIGNTGSKTTIARYLKQLESPGSEANPRERMSGALRGVVESLLDQVQEEGSQAFLEARAEFEHERKLLVSRAEALESELNRPGFSRHLASSLRNVFQTLPVTADC